MWPQGRHVDSYPPEMGGEVEVLTQLRSLAEVRRAARGRLADATAKHGQRSPERAGPAHAYQVTTDRWAECIREAVQLGHSIADVARAAGCATSSVQYRLRQVGSAVG